MKLLPSISLGLAACATVLLSGAAHGRSEPQSPAQHLQSIGSEEASRVLETVRAEQAKLLSGEKSFFHLYSGAPASYEQNRIGPRDAFVSLDLSEIWRVRRKSPETEVFPLYEIVVIPNGHDSPIWKLEVQMGWANDVARVESIKMFYGPPAPF